MLKIDRLTTFRCDSTCKAMLQGPVSIAEIKNEVFNLAANKSPGPDGYTGEFFRKSWHIIGTDFTAAVREFFCLWSDPETMECDSNYSGSKDNGG